MMTAPHSDSGRFHDRCLEADSRAAQSDEEFWAQVNRNLGLAPDVIDAVDQIDQDQLDGLALAPQPCPVCGANVACAYDAEGQPLIHATAEADQ